MSGTVTQLCSVEHTWLCAILHVFHITGSDVKLVNDFAVKIPFSHMLQYRRPRFLDGVRYLRNSVIQFMSVVVETKCQCFVVLVFLHVTVLSVYSVSCLVICCHLTNKGFIYIYARRWCFIFSMRSSLQSIF